MQKYPVRYEKNEISNSLTHDGKLALGIFIGTIAALFIYLLAESYLGKITAIQYLNILPIVVSLLVAGGSAAAIVGPAQASAAPAAEPHYV